MLVFSAGKLSSQYKAGPIDYRFKGGQDAFMKIMFENVRFPLDSRSSIGLSVSRVSVTPQGKIAEIKILNPLSEEIDAMVTDLLKLTTDKWLKCDSVSKNQNFYLQVAFCVFNVQKDFLDKNEFPENGMFLKPVVVTGPQVSITPLLREDDYLTKQCLTNIQTGKYKRALPFINELIKRYPYSKDLYQLRLSIAAKLNDKNLILQDTKKISNFDDDLSLDMIINQ
jgi:hypothetical protein